MLTQKNFTNIPNKTVWMIVFRNVNKPLSHVEFNPIAFSSYWTANAYAKEHYNENVTEVLNVIEIKVPDLEAAMEDFDKTMEDVMKENNTISKEEALLETEERLNKKGLGRYFITTPYVDAYMRSDGYDDEMTFTQFKNQMKLQAQTWESTLDERVGEDKTYVMRHNGKVCAFGTFNHDNYIYTDKLIEVSKEEIGEDWDVT